VNGLVSNISTAVHQSANMGFGAPDALPVAALTPAVDSEVSRHVGACWQPRGRAAGMAASPGGPAGSV